MNAFYCTVSETYIDEQISMQRIHSVSVTMKHQPAPYDSHHPLLLMLMTDAGVKRSLAAVCLSLSLSLSVCVCDSVCLFAA